MTSCEFVCPTGRAQRDPRAPLVPAELIHIGSDGGGEAIAFDFRQDPPNVMLVNLVTIDWSEAILQAESFTEFMDQRRRGEELRWRGGDA